MSCVAYRTASIAYALSAMMLGACHSSYSPSSARNTSADASSVALSSCEGQQASSRNAIASLSIKVTPAPTPTSPVAIYVEGEANKSLTRDSTDQIHRYELPRGVYAVRITMPGFNTATARVTLAAGCNADLTATLRRHAANGR